MATESSSCYDNPFEWGDLVDVTWDDEDYPGMVLSCHGDMLEIEFENPDYPIEIVPVYDVKRRKKCYNEPSSVKAGEMHWDEFLCFASSRVGSSFITMMNFGRVWFDAKQLRITKHATERMNERFSFYKQELLRSLATKYNVSYLESRRFVYSGSIIIECTPDFSTILNCKQVDAKNERRLKELKTEPATECIFSKLINAMKGCRASEFADYVTSMGPYHMRISGIVNHVHVITTTTQFVLTEDCFTLLTVIKHGICFRKWRKWCKRRNRLLRKRH